MDIEDPGLDNESPPGDDRMTVLLAVGQVRSPPGVEHALPVQTAIERAQDSDIVVEGRTGLSRIDR